MNSSHNPRWTSPPRRGIMSSILVTPLRSCHAPLAATRPPRVHCPALCPGQGEVSPGRPTTGFLLPNGWHLTPVGKHVVTTDLPLNILPLKDGKHALVATSGFNRHELSLIDFSGTEPKVVATETVRQSWFGLADGQGRGQGLVVRRRERQAPHVRPEGRASSTRTSPARPGAEEGAAARRSGRAKANRPRRPFNSGLCPGRGERRPLLARHQRRRAVGDRPQGRARRRPLADRRPAVRRASSGRQQLLRLRLGRPAGARRRPGRAAGRRARSPSASTRTRWPCTKDGRLFVACASSNSCQRDRHRSAGIVTETISTALFPKAPEGSTPDALALSPGRQDALRRQRGQQLRRRHRRGGAEQDRR